MIEVPTRFISRRVGASRAGNAEVARHILQAETFQFPRSDIVVLRQDPSIDLHTRGMATQARAVAPESERDFMPLGAGFDVFEIEANQVVAFDDVGVALANFFNELPEHLAFVQFLA